MLVAQQAFLEASDVRGRSRRTLRLTVDASVAGGSSATATIHNISQTGLLLETDVDLPVGEWIGVDLPGSGPRTAQVIWTSEHLFGCRFEEPVTSGTVSAALLRSPFDAADPLSADSLVGNPPGLRHAHPMPTRSQLLTVAGITVALWTVIIGLLALIAI